MSIWAMKSKVVSAEEALCAVRDGAFIAANFWGPGTPTHLWRALFKLDVKDLTVCINNYVAKIESLRDLGGHMVTVLGGLQVSEKGDLAIHSLGDDTRMPHIGGSMDLAWGAERVIVAMTHNAKDGAPKVVRELTLSVTCKRCVDLIVTDLAVVEVAGQGLVLREYAPGWTVEEVVARTGARLKIATDVHEMEL